MANLIDSTKYLDLAGLGIYDSLIKGVITAGDQANATALDTLRGTLATTVTELDERVDNNTSGISSLDTRVASLETSTSDWNESDSTSPSYIKNRTHYEEGGPGVVYEEFEGTEVVVQSFTTYYHTADTAAQHGLVVGKRYHVAIYREGKERIAGYYTAMSYPNNIVALSNAGYTTYAQYGNSIVPVDWGVSNIQSSNTIRFESKNDYGTVHVIVSDNDPEGAIVKMLDEKFIPATIARTNTLQSGVFYNYNNNTLTMGAGDPITDIDFEDGRLSGVRSIESSIGLLEVQNNMDVKGDVKVTGVLAMDSSDISMYGGNIHMDNGKIDGLSQLTMQGGGTINGLSNIYGSNSDINFNTGINAGGSIYASGSGQFKGDLICLNGQCAISGSYGSGRAKMDLYGGAIVKVADIEMTSDSIITGVHSLNMGSGIIAMTGGTITGVSGIYFSNGTSFTGVVSIPSTLNNIQTINMSSGEISGVTKLSTGDKSVDLYNGTLNGIDTINTTNSTLKIGTTSGGTSHTIEFGTSGSPIYTGIKPRIAVSVSGDKTYDSLGIYGIGGVPSENLKISRSKFVVYAHNPSSTGGGMMSLSYKDYNRGLLTVDDITINGGTLNMGSGNITFSGGSIYPYNTRPIGSAPNYNGIALSGLKEITFDDATLSGTVSGNLTATGLVMQGGTLNSGFINTPTISGGTMSDISISGVTFYSGNTYDAGYIDELKAALGLQ